MKKSRNLRRISEPVSMGRSLVMILILNDTRRSDMAWGNSALDGMRASRHEHPLLNERSNRTGGDARPSIDPAIYFFISSSVFSAPFFTPLPTALVPFFTPFPVSLAAVLVASAVLSAAFSVALPVFTAAFLVGCAVFFAAVFVGSF